MMIAFITVRSSLVPLIEGLCAQIYFRFEISVVGCEHAAGFPGSTHEFEIDCFSARAFGGSFSMSNIETIPREGNVVKIITTASAEIQTVIWSKLLKFAWRCNGDGASQNSEICRWIVLVKVIPLSPTKSFLQDSSL